MLLHFIQRNSPGDTITADNIDYALGEYSKAYFQHEIRNEVDGYLTEDEISSLLRVFEGLKDDLFYVATIQKRLPGKLHEQLPRILGDLFNCSCIGNWKRDENGNLIGRIYRYKVPGAHVDLEEPMVLHPSLGIAFNIPINAEETRAIKKSSHDSGVEGRVAYLNHSGSYGTIAVREKMFRFNPYEVIGYPSVRMVAGDYVTFDPPANVIIGNGESGEQLPLATRVRFLRRPTDSDKSDR
jgi:hypothetical protein